MDDTTEMPQEVPWQQLRALPPESVRITVTLVMHGRDDAVQIGWKVEDWVTDDLLELETWTCRSDVAAPHEVYFLLAERLTPWKDQLLPF